MISSNPLSTKKRLFEVPMTPLMPNDESFSDDAGVYLSPIRKRHMKIEQRGSVNSIENSNENPFKQISNKKSNLNSQNPMFFNAKKELVTEVDGIKGHNRDSKAVLPAPFSIKKSSTQLMRAPKRKPVTRSMSGG